MITSITLSSLAMFADNSANTNAWDIPSRAINLPSYHDITTQELDKVIDVIIQLIGA